LESKFINSYAERRYLLPNFQHGDWIGDNGGGFSLRIGIEIFISFAEYDMR